MHNEYGARSAAASGWAGWALAQPELWSSIHPITTTGADFAHHITASPPRFENPVASLHYVRYLFVHFVLENILIVLM